MVDDELIFSSPQRNKAWLNEMFGRMYTDTDGVIKLKEVNKMKDWLVVHDMSDEVVMVKKASIEFISKSSDGSAYLSTRSGSLCVKEKYNDIVRRIIQ